MRGSMSKKKNTHPDVPLAVQTETSRFLRRTQPSAISIATAPFQQHICTKCQVARGQPPKRSLTFTCLFFDVALHCERGVAEVALLKNQFLKMVSLISKKQCTVRTVVVATFELAAKRLLFFRATCNAARHLAMWMFQSLTHCPLESFFQVGLKIPCPVCSTGHTGEHRNWHKVTNSKKPFKYPSRRKKSLHVDSSRYVQSPNAAGATVCICSWLLISCYIQARLLIYQLHPIASNYSDYSDQSAWTKGLDIWSKSRKNYKHRSIDHNSMVPKEWNVSVASQNAYCHCYNGWIDQYSVACFKSWIYTLRFCVSLCRPQHFHGRFASKNIDTDLENPSQKNAERSPYQHVSTNTNWHRSNLQELSLPAKDALFVGVPCTFSWHAADVAEGCQVSHGPRDHLLERAACLRWHQNWDWVIDRLDHNQWWHDRDNKIELSGI